MDQPDPSAVVHAHLQAFNQHDLDALLDSPANDAFHTTGHTTGHTTVRGRPEPAALFQGAITDLNARLTIRTLPTSADRVAAELTKTLTGNDKQQAIPIAIFYQIADRKIARARSFLACW
jgi:limonene-1,2-epoxide hydrolase